ncbi:response regulator [Oceanobacillus sp. CFH 90083]|uniref:response regulator n=1 Tax=Oceanobacillus sp. CFH 90083 TaxID=2592336 RepID=UPI00128DC65C|nr:response regulator [Oceanobacillus sp. CFH 90083]
MNILVAEDDYRVADIHCQYLEESLGVNHIERTANAKETLEKLRERPFDLLLLDVYLPDELGTNMIEVYKKENPSLQIILITAATDKKILEKAYLSGVIDYLVKPIALERLAEAVKNAIDNINLIQSSEEITQQLADQLFQSKHKGNGKQQEYPKGIDELTLKKVKDVLQKSSEGMTAEKVGKKLGVSRTTARRYLEYLISVEYVRAELEYGVGRPERKYVI